MVGSAGRLAAVVMGGSMLAMPAAAQTVPADAAPAASAGDGQSAAASVAAGRQTYDAAYFARYAPSTALQMVQRVPGFTVESVDPNVRGFGQAAGNVVINGQRPSSKSDSLETILARIPASRVTRIEVAAGEAFGADFTGRAQVLNLVTSAAGGLAGTIEASVLRDYEGHFKPQGSVSASLRRGPSTFNASIKLENNRSSEEGFDRVTSLPDGREVEYRYKVNRIDDPNVAVAGSWDYDGGANRTAHLNARAFVDRFRLKQTNAVTPASGPLRDDRLTQRYDTDEYEVGGDVTRPLAGGGLKLIGLASRRNRTLTDESFNRVTGAVIGGFTQILDDRLEETLLRVVWNRADLAGWTVETGAEGVLNTLDSNVDLFRLAAGGARTRIDLPVDQAVVKELRGEGFVNVGKPLTPKLRVDAGLTYEASRLTVTGDANAERTLGFLKPKATVDWRPSAKWHGQLSIQRSVAQLQFEDFISGAELTNDRVNGGNAELLPQRSWDVLATIDHPILGDGLFKFEVGYNAVALVQDRVPTPEGFDAPGNLGAGHVFIVRNRIDAPLRSLGIKGGRLTLYGSYAATSVIDPYTLRARPFSGNQLFHGEANFRQDLGKFAWGFGLSGNTRATYYRRDELDMPGSQVPYVTAFAEWRPDARTTLNLGLDNLTGAKGTRTRRFFAPDRRTASASLIEYRERSKHVVPSITVKRSLG